MSCRGRHCLSPPSQSTHGPSSSPRAPVPRVHPILGVRRYGPRGAWDWSVAPSYEPRERGEARNLGANWLVSQPTLANPSWRSLLLDVVQYCGSDLVFCDTIVFLDIWLDLRLYTRTQRWASTRISAEGSDWDLNHQRNFSPRLCIYGLEWYCLSRFIHEYQWGSRGIHQNLNETKRKRRTAEYECIW